MSLAVILLSLVSQACHLFDASTRRTTIVADHPVTAALAEFLHKQACKPYGESGPTRSIGLPELPEASSDSDDDDDDELDEDWEVDPLSA